VCSKTCLTPPTLLEIEIFRQPASDYNCAVTKKANPKRNLRPVTARAQMREFGSDAEWFWVEFLVYYDQRLIRAFGYVRREDGKDIANGVYQALDDLGERAWRWTKRDGEWQTKWRTRWSR